MLIGFASFACYRAGYAAADLPKPAVDLAVKEGTTEATAIFAGGCFWCTEAVFEQIEGVTGVVSGYAGGSQADADYEKVSAGMTAHAEAIKITYDPTKIAYGDLLRIFFTTHDPTTLNRQGPDWGRQYRSAVFYQSNEEKRIVEAYIKQLDEAKIFKEKIVTALEPLETSEDKGFFAAEKYHQDYAKHNPDNRYVQANAIPKVKKVREKFADQLKPQK